MAKKQDAGVEMVTISKEAQAVVAKLPKVASAEAELDWVRAHPSMAKKQPLELVPNDVYDAPSQAAVLQLLHWLKHKNEFYKQVLSVQRKAVDKVVLEEEDGQIELVEKLLKDYINSGA